MDKRKHMGKDKEGVIFPVAPNLFEMSDSYLQFIEEIKKEIQKQRVSVVMNANTSMICLYWNIGRAILKKQEEEGWGAKVIDRMSKDLKIAFPEMSGFSPRNIKYMRKFAQCWGDYEIVQRVVAQIPWRTNITLMDKLKIQEERIWYAGKTRGKKRPLFQNHAVSLCEDENGRFISYDEAHYICGILNSNLVREYMMNSSDSRSFPIRPRVKIPKYDKTNKIHKRIAFLSKRAHECYSDDREIAKILNELDELYLNLIE